MTLSELTQRGPARVIRRITADQPGSTLIAIGSIHGNEPAGLTALDRITNDIEERAVLHRGEFLALAGNLSALGSERRFIHRDLNRDWDPDQIARLNGDPVSSHVEDREQRELLDELHAAFARARGDVYLLDLHTTSGAGRPFSVFADTLRSRRFARILPNPIILGLEEHLNGTLVDYVANLGHIASAFEGGQHDDPDAPDNLAAAVWIALSHTQMIDGNASASLKAARARLARLAHGLPRALEIRKRHAITPEDRFAMHPGFASFDRVEEGHLLGRDRSGNVLAPVGGYLLMPLYQELGDDGFFVVAPVREFWLTISRWLRQLRADKVVHLMPGVRRDPETPGVLIVDRHVARWVALQILHLLGFRRLSEDGTLLRVRRRQYDRP
jgi:succinylglutamate desuccinylase